jgi:hypothetical protein
MRPRARQTGMMSRRQVRRGLAVAAGWGLLGMVLAGCGSVAAPAPAGAGGTAAAAAASAAASAAVPQVGCASVNQATMVTITRLTHLMRPISPLLFANREPAQVRALFRDFCDAVTHPEVTSVAVHCPADFGLDYAGVFYDGNRVLARYTYTARGCQQVDVIVGSTTRFTLVAGRAAAAAPHLASDWSAVLAAAKPAFVPSSAQVNPGGAQQPG